MAAAILCVIIVIVIFLTVFQNDGYGPEESASDKLERLKTDAQAYADQNYTAPAEPTRPTTVPHEGVKYSLRPLSPEDYERLSRTVSREAELSFVEQLINLVNDHGVRDAELYRASGIDRRLWSKMMSDKYYKPSKDTATALCFGLRLSVGEAETLLSAAGYTFSQSIRRDLILKYLLREKEYNLVNVNIVLDHLGEKILGRSE